MKLPPTIAVHDLASPRNAVSRDVWAAVKSGEARLVWRDQTVTAIRFDRARSHFLLTVGEAHVPAPTGTMLTIEQVKS